MRSCREVSRDLASGALEQAPWHRRLLSSLHLLFCSHCRQYRDELEAIGEAARERAVGVSNSSSVERLEATLLGGERDS